MEHARLRKPSVSQGKGRLPGDRAFLAAAAKCVPPMPNRSCQEYAETVEVPRYRIVVEVACTTDLSHCPLWRTGSCIRSRSCCLISRSFAPMRLRIVLRLTTNRPNLFFPLMCGRVPTVRPCEFENAVLATARRKQPLTRGRHLASV